MIKVKPKTFLKSLNESKYKLMLSKYSEKELSNENFTLLKVRGENAGLGIKILNNNSIEIILVHNNSNVKGLGKKIMQEAIALCRKIGFKFIYIDYFEGFLEGFYNSLGFIEYHREPYNPLYDEDGEFKKLYGEKGVVYSKLVL